MGVKIASESLTAGKQSKGIPAFKSGKSEPRWHSLAIIGLLLIQALAIWDGPGITRPYPGQVVALGGVAAILAGLGAWNSRTTNKSKLTYQVLILLIGWFVLSTLTSLDRFRSLQTTAAWIAGMGIFVITGLSTSSLNRWLAMVSGMAGMAGLASLYGLSQGQASLASTFSNSDTFSIIPLAGFFFSLVLSLQANSHLKALGFALQLLLGFAIIRTSSRSALLGLVVGLGLFSICYRFLPRKRPHSRELYRALVVPVIVGCLTLLTGVASNLLGRLGELRTGADSQGVTMREDVLQHGLRATLARPLLGSGPGTFALAYQEYRPRNLLPDYIYVNVAHNDYVEAAVELGWPGFFLLAAFLSLNALRGVRLVRSNIAIGEVSALLGGLAAILAFCTFNFSISVPATLFWQMVLLGLLHGVPVATATPRRKSSAMPILGFTLVSGGLFSLYFGATAFRANQCLAISNRMLEALRWEEALPPVNQAIQLQPMNANLLVTRAKLKARVKQFSDHGQAKLDAESDFLAALRYSPRDIHSLKAALNYYQTERNYARAEKVLRDLLQRAPYLEGLDIQLSRLLVLQNKLAEAADTLYHGSPSEDEVNKLLIPILVSLETKQPRQGVALLGQWCQDESEYPLRLIKKIARECLKTKQWDAGTRILAFLSEKLPDDTEVLYLNSLSLDYTGDKDGARAMVERILKSPIRRAADASYYDLALVQWAVLQGNLDQPGPVTDRLEKRFKERPRSVPLCLLLSEAYLRQKRPDLAIEIASKGLDVSPDDPTLLARMGTCMSSQGMTDLAQDYFEQALKLNPGLREARTGRARKPINWSKQVRRLPLANTPM